jgi:hypothetical protein
VLCGPAAEGAIVSEHWELYVCQHDDYRAYVSYDHGIAGELEALPVDHLVKVRLAFHSPDERGLPNQEELQTASGVEDGFKLFVEARGGAYVGRVTVAGARHFYAYCDAALDDLQRFLTGQEADTGYALQYLRESDPGREAYWSELYPSEDDWQVVQDLKVISNLEAEGDPLTEPREIDHVACFGSADSRAAFMAWASSAGYVIGVTHEHPGSEAGFTVECHHTGVPNLEGINPHSVGLRRKAAEFGGDYDGWGTAVLRKGRTASG